MYVLHGDVKKPRRLFLFNDLIVVARKDWRDKYHLVEMAPLAAVRLSDVRSKNQNQHLFEIEMPPQETGSGIPVAPTRFTFSVTSKTAKMAWMDAVKALIDVTISSKEYKPEPTPPKAETDTEDDQAPGSNVPQIVPEHKISEADEVASSNHTSDDGVVKKQPSKPNSPTSRAASMLLPASFGLNLSNVTRTKSMSEIDADSNVTPKKPKAASQKSVTLYASSSKISDSISSQTALDSVTKLSIATMRARLKDQERVIAERTNEANKMHDRVVQLEKENTTLSAQNTQLNQRISSIENERTVLAHRFDSSKEDQSRLIQSQKEEIVHLNDLITKLHSENSKQATQFQQERHALEQRHDADRKELKQHFEKEVAAIRSQAEVNKKLFTQNIEELQLTLKKRDDLISKLEQEKLVSMQAQAKQSQTELAKEAHASQTEMLQNQVADLDRCLIEAKEVARGTNEAVAKGEADMVSAQTLNAKLTTEYRAATETITSDYQQREDELLHTLNAKDLEVQKLSKEISAGEYRLQDAIKEVKSVKRKLEDTQRALSQKDVALEQALGQLRNFPVSEEIHQNEGKRDRQTITNMERRNAQLEKEVEELHGQLQKRQATIQKLDNDLAQQQSLLETAVQDLNKVTLEQAELISSCERLSTVEQKFVDMEQQYTSLLDEHDLLTEELVRLKDVDSKYLELQRDHHDAVDHINAAHFDLMTARKQIEQQQLELTSLKESMTAEQCSVKELKDQLAQSTATCQKLETERAETAQALADRVQAYDKLSTEHADVAADLKHRNQAFEILATKQGETAEKLHASLAQIASLETNKAALQSEIEDLKHKMRAAAVLKKRWKEAEATKSEQQQRLDEEAGLIRRLQDTIEASLKKENELSSTKLELLKDLDLSRAQKLELDHQLEIKSQEYKHLESILNAMSVMMDPLAKRSAATFDEIQTQLVAVINSKRDADRVCRELESTLESTQSSLSELRRQHQEKLDDIARLQEKIQNTEAAAATQKAHFESLIESHVNDNQRLLAQIQDIIKSDDEKKEAKVWIEKYESLQTKFMESQKELIALQAEVADLRERMEVANEELDNYDEELLLKQSELRHANDTIQGLRMRIQNLAAEQAHVADNTNEMKKYIHQWSEFKQQLQEENESLRIQNDSLKQKLRAPPAVSRSSEYIAEQPLKQGFFNRSGPMSLEELHDANNMVTMETNIKEETPKASKTDLLSRSLPAKFDAPSKYESDIQRRINNCLNALSDAVRIRGQHERDITSLFGLDDTNCSASMTLQFLGMVTRLDSLSVQHNQEFEQVIHLMRNELGLLMVAVKDMADAILKTSMNYQGENTVLRQELLKSQQIVGQLQAKMEAMNNELMDAQIEVARQSSMAKSMGEDDRDQVETDMEGIIRHLTTIFDPLLDVDDYVREKAKRMMDKKLMFSGGTGDGTPRQLSPQERWKLQLHQVLLFLKAVVIHASGFVRQQAMPQSPVGRPNEPLITFSELQRSLNQAHVVIQRLKSSLQEATGENERLQEQIVWYKSELQRFKEAYAKLKHMTTTKDDELKKVTDLLMRKEVEMHELSMEKSSISQLVLQACQDLEEMVPV